MIEKELRTKITYSGIGLLAIGLILSQVGFTEAASYLVLLGLLVAIAPNLTLGGKK